MITRDVLADLGQGQKTLTLEKSSPLRPYKAPTLQSSGVSPWLGWIIRAPYAPTELNTHPHMRLRAPVRMLGYAQMWRRGVVVYNNLLKDIDKKPLQTHYFATTLPGKSVGAGVGTGPWSCKLLKTFEKGGI